MKDNETSVIVLGLAIGVAFFVIMAAMSDSIGTRFPTTPTQFARIASKLEETQEFLSNYPDSNSTVYLRDIVEYSFQDDSGKYAGLRISINRNGGVPIFMQINCFIFGNELDSIEIHGSRLEGIDAFLQDKRCPETIFVID